MQKSYVFAARRGVLFYLSKVYFLLCGLPLEVKGVGKFLILLRALTV